MKVNNPISPINLALVQVKKHFHKGTRFMWEGNVLCEVINTDFIVEENTIKTLCWVNYRDGKEKQIIDVFDDDFEPKFPQIIILP